MQLCIRRRDRAAGVAHYRRPEQTVWRELELLPSRGICLLYEMAMRGVRISARRVARKTGSRPLSGEQSR
jgi:hypothetical protein